MQKSNKKGVEMVSIGLRVQSNHTVYYSILKEEGDEVVLNTIDTLHIPLALKNPERLNYIRNTLVDVMDEFKVSKGIIKVLEGGRINTQAEIERCYVEGVLLEAFSSSDIENYEMAKISTLARSLGLETNRIKPYFEGRENWPEFPPEYERDWSGLSKEERESYLSSRAALNL